MSEHEITSPDIKYSRDQCEAHIENEKKHPDYEFSRNSKIISYDSVNSATNSYDFVPIDRVFGSTVKGGIYNIQPPQSKYNSIFYDPELNNYNNPPQVYPKEDLAISPDHIITGGQMKELLLTDESKEKNTTIIQAVQQITINDKLPYEEQDEFFEKLKEFSAIKVLKLQNITLTNFSFGKIPKLYGLELSGETVTIEQIHEAIKCPGLRSINYKNTPIRTNYLLKRTILFDYPNIDYINNEPVSFATYHDVLKEYHHTNNTDEEKYLKKIFRNLVLRLPEVRYYTLKYNTFSPNYITVLQLNGMQIRKIYLSEFTELVFLSLSDNLIEDLNSSGIEKCQKLMTVDLSMNRINIIMNIENMKYLPNLLHVYLHSNQFDYYYDEYRRFIIWFFRYLPGTASLSGIQSIDGIPVTVDEYVKACNSNTKFTNEELLRQKWNYNLQLVVGGNFIERNMINFATILNNLQSLSLPCRGLHCVDLSSLPNLRYLNLRGNFLINVHNLKICTHLEYLDLSDNVFLNIYSTQNQLMYLRNLYYLNLSPHHVQKIPSGDECETCQETEQTASPYNKSYRSVILSHILPYCRNLTYLDRIFISPEEIKQIGLYDKEDGIYRYFLRKSGIPINESDDDQIKMLCNKGVDIIKDLSFFKDFKSLVRLDLSCNSNEEQYKNLYHGTIPEFIYELKHLQVLNLNKLNLENDIDGRVKVIETLENLIKFDCHEEEVNDDELNKVLSKCKKQLFNWNSQLYHVDVDLTLQRLKSRGIISEPKHLMLIAAKFIAGSISRINKIEYLDISNIDLKDFSFEDYNYNIRNKMKKDGIIRDDERESDVRNELFYLNLSHNSLNHDSFKDFRCEKLRVLDLRWNKFDDPQKLSNLILGIPSLKNVFVSPQKYYEEDVRMVIITNIVRKIWDDLNQEKQKEHYTEAKIPIDGNLLAKFFIEYPLKAIDNKWIMPSEISSAIKDVIGRDYTMPPVFKLGLAKARFDPRFYVAIYYNETKQKLCTKIKFTNMIDTMHGRQFHVSYDYSECDLDFNEPLKFSNFGIRQDSPLCLNLSCNNIDEKQLHNIIFNKTNSLDGSMGEFDYGAKTLKILDLRKNNIGLGPNKNGKELIEFLNHFPLLEELYIEGNPISKELSFRIFRYNFDLLQKPECILKKIDGYKVDDFRKEVVQDINIFKSTRRLINIIDKTPNNMNCMNFSNQKISDISYLASLPEIYSHITEIDLSRNMISEIPYNAFKAFPRLEKLNISDNPILPRLEKWNISDIPIVKKILPRKYNRGFEDLIDAITKPLSSITTLEHLTMTNNYNPYFVEVCQRLRLLKTLDGAENPYYYKYSERQDAENIQKLAGLKSLPISVILDLRECDITDPAIAQQIAISANELGIKKLYLRDDNRKHIEYIFVTKCQSLEQINNDKINNTRRYNAMKEYSKNMHSVFDKLEKGLELYDIYDDVKDYIEKGKKFVEINGTLLSKFEIFITFQQIYSIIVRFFKRIKWPRSFFTIYQWFSLLALQFKQLFAIFQVPIPKAFQYSLFIVYSLAPVVFFMLFKYLKTDIIIKWSNDLFMRTFWCLVWTFAVLLIFSWGSSFIFTINETLSDKKPPGDFKKYGGWLTGFSFLFVVILGSGLYYIRKKREKRNIKDKFQEELFSQKTEMLKARIFLFLFTISYEPSISYYGSLLQCDENGKFSVGIEDLACADSKWYFPHVVSLALMILSFFIVIYIYYSYIKKGLKYLKKSRGIEKEEKRIENIKKQIKLIKSYNEEEINNGAIDIIVIDTEASKARKKHDLKNAKAYLELEEEKFNQKYHEEIENYEDPARYLYEQYNIKEKYSKNWELGQKFLMTIFSIIKTKYVFWFIHVVVHSFMINSLSRKIY